MHNIKELLKTILLFIVLWGTSVFIMTNITGCATIDRDTKTVYRTVNKSRTMIPGSLLLDCNVTKPISIDRYMRASVVERNTFLTVYINDLLSDIGICRNRVRAIRDWEINQDLLFKKKNEIKK